MNTRTPAWKAPVAEFPISGEIRIPGSKSQTNRAFVLASLANSESIIDNALIARDTELMLSAIEKLGAKITYRENRIFIEPGLTSESEISIDVGLAGTVMRFIPPLAALTHSLVKFDGDEAARVRPMQVMLDGLSDLGVEIIRKNDGFLPFEVNGHGHISKSEVAIDASSSSQFVSGLLLAAARFDNGLKITHRGGTLPSFPHIEMTMKMLEEIGINCVHLTNNINEHSWQVKPHLIPGHHWQIEPDLSNAAPFLAAAMVTGGKVTILDWPTTTTQAGGRLPEILEAMGAKITHDEVGLTVIGPKKIKPLRINLGEVGELTPSIAALLALAEGESEITGIAHLKGHETDRIAALSHDLSEIGVQVTANPDGLKIVQGKLHGAKWKSYADHRMATAGAIVGLKVPGIEIDDISCTSKTMNNFESLWLDLVNR